MKALPSSASTTSMGYAAVGSTTADKTFKTRTSRVFRFQASGGTFGGRLSTYLAQRERLLEVVHRVQIIPTTRPHALGNDPKDDHHTSVESGRYHMLAGLRAERNGRTRCPRMQAQVCLRSLPAPPATSSIDQQCAVPTGRAKTPHGAAENAMAEECGRARMLPLL